jgi:hypothetical protein
VPKTKLFFKLTIVDDSGSVHNVSCFDDKIAKFLGIKIGTNVIVSLPIKIIQFEI